MENQEKGWAEIQLSGGHVALVSHEDFDRVNQFKWCASVGGRGNKKIYAIRFVTPENAEKRLTKRGRWEKRRVKIRMHRFIMGVPTGADDTRVVDHLNDNGLDNRRENLNICTQEENLSRIENWKRKKTEVEPWL